MVDNLILYFSTQTNVEIWIDDKIWEIEAQCDFFRAIQIISDTQPLGLQVPVKGNCPGQKKLIRFGLSNLCFNTQKHQMNIGFA